MKTCASILILFCFAHSLIPVARGVEFGTDLIFAGALEKSDSNLNHGVGIKSHQTVYFGEELAGGLAVDLEFPNSGVFEITVGPTGRYGLDTYLEFGVGFLFRDFGSFIERGPTLRLAFGKKFEIDDHWVFKVSLPLVFKFITSGVSTKTSIDYVPYLGVGYRL